MVALSFFAKLSKTFDCATHNLLKAKLDVYGFDDQKLSLKLTCSYLSKRKHKTKRNSSYSHWNDANHGVPQGSILHSLFFYIFIYIYIYIDR